MTSKAATLRVPLKTHPHRTKSSKNMLPWEDARSERSASERRVLKACLPHPGKVAEKIETNLFPVVECPEYLHSVAARFQTDSETSAARGAHGPLPCLPRNARIYALAPVTANPALAPAVKKAALPSQERVAEWLANPRCAQLVTDLLDRMLRYHAWKRGLRFDEMHNLLYFTRSKPKSICWEIEGRQIQEEVTAPLMRWTKTEFGVEAEAQFGWRHRAVRAEFVQIQGALFVRLEPTWFMTELDGRTPATPRQVGPLDSQHERNGGNSQVLRSLQFWSTVLTKGHRELRIDTGRNPIRVRLIPPSDSNHNAFSSDQMKEGQPVLARIDGAERIPELIPLT